MSQPVLIISPKFFPIEDGLGQYTGHFYKTLKGHLPTKMLTSKTEELISYNQNDPDVFCEISSWHFRGWPELSSSIEMTGAKTLLFQYVPFMYAPRGGINFSIVFFMFYLRWFKGYEIQIMYHELHYPFRLTLKESLMWFCHHLMLIISGISANKIFCSTQGFSQDMGQLLPFKKKSIFHLPVSSNMAAHPLNPDKEQSRIEFNELRQTIAQDDELLLGCFGSFHPSKRYDIIIRQVLEANQKGPHKYKILFIGASKNKLIDQLNKDLREEAKSIIEATGFLENEKVGTYLHLCDAFMAYFVDGISTRRGSMLAALQNGVPVVSTQSPWSDDVFKQKNFIKLFPTSPSSFENHLADLFTSGWVKKTKTESEGEVRDFYEREFSWQNIVRKYMDLGGKK